MRLNISGSPIAPSWTTRRNSDQPDRRVRQRFIQVIGSQRDAERRGTHGSLGLVAPNDGAHFKTRIAQRAHVGEQSETGTNNDSAGQIGLAGHAGVLAWRMTALPLSASARATRARG